MSRRIVRWLQTSRGSGVILILLLLALWQYSALYVMDTPTWPPVTRIFEAWFADLLDGTSHRAIFSPLSGGRCWDIGSRSCSASASDWPWAIIGSPII